MSFRFSPKQYVEKFRKFVFDPLLTLQRPTDGNFQLETFNLERITFNF